MIIQDIKAKDLSLGDVLGEGMRIWMFVKTDVEPCVTVWWSSRSGCCMFNATAEEMMQQLKVYYSDDLVRVMRSV